MSAFINLFETESKRVKGLAFHPTRPWILSSLHNGMIQLWDYRIKTMVDQFNEHDGPVRGIAFHPTQPIFVSGGDDFKIKVWNYKERRCLFTLLGHTDYVRTVQFHKEYPWILTASDDQSIRIWNWQSRQCICVLTGHSHYVMCAQFHPTEDLVVSASLDLTVRVWDISALRKKNIAPNTQPEDAGQRLQNELFGSTDVYVKFVLEGHDRGVNWASFHPTQPLIISGADDRQIKLWRMNDTKAWEVDTFRGHYNNISSCIFHPRADLVISNSEDKSVRVWDLSKRTNLLTYRRENDRFWILAQHPELNLFAAGHDSGLLIFKLEKERPTYFSQKNELLFYIKEKYLRIYEYGTARDMPILSIVKRPAAPRFVHYNPAERAVIVFYELENNVNSYDYYQITKNSDAAVDPRRSSCVSVAWVARDRFAVLEKSNILVLKNLQNETTKSIQLDMSFDMLLPAYAGALILRSEDRLVLYDIHQFRSLAEVTLHNVKFVSWSPKEKDGLVAFLGRDSIVIANKRLEILCSVRETMRIKGGAWSENEVFIYNTTSHIKYLLPNGDGGIIRTLDIPIYITAVRGNKIHCLDRDIRNRSITIDTTEFSFKQALINNNFNEVMKMVRNSKLMGQAIISYLQKKGHPEIALHFVKDENTRFSLALECGNIDIALDAAKKLDDKDIWQRLGEEALRQGNHQVVELAYQKTKNFERLSFLYLITGNVDNLRTMAKIAQKRNDVMGRFQTALLLGDVAERIKVLEETGQVQLAYMTARSHGLEEDATRLWEKIQRVQQKKLAGEGVENADQQVLAPPAIDLSRSKLLFPAVPILKLADSNWPLLTVTKGPYDVSFRPAPAARGPSATTETPKTGVGRYQEDIDVAEASGWGDDLDVALDGGEGKPAQPEENVGAEPDLGGGDESAWGGDDLSDMLSDIKISTGPSKGKSNAVAVFPNEGMTAAQAWTMASQLPGDHASAGGMGISQLLSTQIGAVNFAPFASHVSTAYRATRTWLPLSPGSSPICTYGPRRTDDGPRSLPLTVHDVSSLTSKLQLGYKATTTAKLPEAIGYFESILAEVPFVVVSTRAEAQEVKELVGICREYLVGLKCEIKRKELLAKEQENAIRIAELAAYFTHCNLEPPHLQLTLRSAMAICVKLKNLQSAASFARRLIDLAPPQNVVEQAQKVLIFAEQNKFVEEKPMKYDERNPFVICGSTFTPIYKGSPVVRCTYCSAPYMPEFQGKQCQICTISEIGRENCSGVQIMQNNRGNDPPSISLVAGGAAGMVADAIVHPIDTVRARLQVQSGNNGLVSTYYNIVTKEGWRALYRGFGIVVAFTTPAHALYFLGYEFGKKYIQPHKPADQKGPLVHFSAGLVAECMGALIWTPMDVVKQRLQTQQGAIKYKNSLHAIMTIGKQEGLRGLYRGFFASVATYGPFVGIYFTCYEQNKKLFAKLHKVDTDKLPLYTHLVSGFAAGATGAAITCPLDVVKTRMQVRAAGDTTGYKTTVQAFKTILAQEGPKTFFKGLSARILWIAPGTAITIAACAFDKLHINTTNEK